MSEASGHSPEGPGASLLRPCPGAWAVQVSARGGLPVELQLYFVRTMNTEGGLAGSSDLDWKECHVACGAVKQWCNFGDPARSAWHKMSQWLLPWLVEFSCKETKISSKSQLVLLSLDWHDHDGFLACEAQPPTLSISSRQLHCLRR